MAKITYKDFGVDLDVYQQSMSRLPRLVQRTYSPHVMRLDGGFTGLFKLDFSSPLFSRNYDDPVLVSCTDGVGTKLKVAAGAGIHNSVGIDLVAMCVNDAICCGAEPLFFLDYTAMGHDDPDLLEQLVEGMTEGCLQSDCALVGGETAIMPDLYAPGDYDLAGFSVGVVERKRVLDGRAIAEGDVVLGLASSGLHSNGYSLVRKVVFDVARLKMDDVVPETQCSVAQTLLQPTRIYVHAVRKVLSHYRVKNVVHGIAHITGGGLLENVSRIVPKGMEVVVDPGSWEVPKVFPWIQSLGDIDPEEMERVFNMGIGLTMIVSPYFVDSVHQQLKELGYPNQVIGHVRSGRGGAVWNS